MTVRDRGFLNDLSEVRRARKESTMHMPALVYVTYLASTPEEVWRAWTDPEVTVVY
jgi:hypothetical protein